MLIRLILGLLFLSIFSNCSLKVTGCFLKTCLDQVVVEEEKEKEEEEEK